MLLAVSTIDVEIQAREGDLIASVRATLEAADDESAGTIALDMMGMPYNVEAVDVDAAERGYQVGPHIVFERKRHLSTWNGATVEYGIRFGEQKESRATIPSPLFLPGALPKVIQETGCSWLPTLRIVSDELVADLEMIALPRKPWGSGQRRDLVSAALFAGSQVSSLLPPLKGYAGAVISEEEQRDTERLLAEGHRLFGVQPVNELLVVPVGAVQRQFIAGTGIILDAPGRTPEEKPSRTRRLVQLALALSANWFGAAVQIEGDSGLELWYGIQGGIQIALVGVESPVQVALIDELRAVAAKRVYPWTSRQDKTMRHVCRIAVAVGEVLASANGQMHFRAFLREVWGARPREAMVLASLRAMGVAV